MCPQFSSFFFSVCLCSFTQALVLSVIFSSLSFHTWTAGGLGETTTPALPHPPLRLGLGTSFGRRCTLYFFFSPWFKAMALHGNWTERLCRAESDATENSHQRMILFWMNASNFLHRQLWIFVYFLDFLWLVDLCWGERDTFLCSPCFSPLKTGFNDWGKQRRYSKPLRSCISSTVVWSATRCPVAPHAVQHMKLEMPH